MLKAPGPGPKVPCQADANPLTDKDKSCATVDSCCLLAATVWIPPPIHHSTPLYSTLLHSRSRFRSWVVAATGCPPYSSHWWVAGDGLGQLQSSCGAGRGLDKWQWSTAADEFMRKPRWEMHFS